MKFYRWLDEIFKEVRDEMEEEAVIQAIHSINPTLSSKQIRSFFTVMYRN